MDTEIFSFKKLEDANNKLFLTDDREHVTKYFLRSNKIKNLIIPKKRMTPILGYLILNMILSL